MNDTKNRETWSEKQIKFAHFLARGKKNKFGEKRTMAQFAAAIDVNPNTLYEWKYKDGFMQLVFDIVMKDLIEDLPNMAAAMKAKATGQEAYYTDSKGKKRVLKPDTQAFMAIMRQAQLLKSEKVDHTSGGAPMPAPILELPAYKGADPEPESD